MVHIEVKKGKEINKKKQCSDWFPTNEEKERRFLFNKKISV
ncbi:MAG: hypothetical protein ACFFAN_06055 [Promethearchaeota archaeon]